MPVALLAGAAAAAAVLILYLNRSSTFFYDEWYWYGSASHQTLSTLFEQDNGHLVVVPRLLYQAILEVLGPHYRVFQAISLAAMLSSAVLFFVLARKRAGSWLALPPAILLMFFGSGWDAMATGVGMNLTLCVACGLGAFLLVERRTLASDVLAGVLVLIGISSFSGEFAIACGIALYLILDGRWRRVWVMAVPILYFVIWRLQAPRTVSTEEITVEHVGSAPSLVFEMFASAMATATGAFRPPASGEPGIDLSLGYPLAAIAIVLLGYVLLRERRPLTNRFLAFASVPIVFWALTALAGRDPSWGRYNLLALPFVFLALFELIGNPLTLRRQWIAVGAVFVLAMVPNVVALRNGAAVIRSLASTDRAITAVVEMHPEDAASPAFDEVSLSGLAGFNSSGESDLVFITPSTYLRSVRQFGSVAGAPDEIADENPQARAGADRALASLLLPRILEEAARPAASLPSTAPGSGCQPVDPASGASGPIELPAEGLTFTTADAEADLKLRRFADSSAIEALAVPAHAEWALRIPGDEAPEPWIVEVESAGAVVACPPT